MIEVLLGAASVLLLLLPGAALLRREEWARAEPLELLAVSFASSAALWAVAIWLIAPLEVVGVGLRGFAALAITGSVAWLARARRAEVAAAARAIAAGAGPRLEAALALAALALRVPFTRTRIACAVGDMTAHTYMAELIYMRNGMPSSHEPLLPISSFGQFSPGFHTLAALASLLSGAPTYRAAVWALALSCAALSLSLFAVLRRLGVERGVAAAAAVAALLLSRNPQLFVQWGGGPTLLAAAIVLLAFRECLDLVEGPAEGRPWDLARSARLGLLGAGAVLCHLLPVASFLYVALAVALVRIARARPPVGPLLARAAPAALAGALLVLPFVLVTPLRPTPRIEAWAHDWFRLEASRALAAQGPALRALGLGDAADSIGPHTGPFYVLVFLGALPALLLAAGWALRAWRERASLAVEVSAVVAAAYLALFAGGMAERLPLWPSLYPTRTGLWLMIPLGAALAALLEEARRALPPRALAALALAWVAAFAVEGWRLRDLEFGMAFYDAARQGRPSVAAIVANEAAGGAFWVATYNRDNAPLVEDDLRALAWIRKSTPPDAVVGTNYGDGGSLVVAVGHRRTLSPHYYWFFYEREMEAWQARASVDYVLVGAGGNPGYATGFTYRREALDADPRYERVFASGAARVYRVRAQ